MSITRRLLPVIMIVVSFLFSIQSASAEHALDSGSVGQACDEVGPLPKLSMSFLSASAPSDNTCAMGVPHTTSVATDQRASSCTKFGPTLMNLGLSSGFAPNQMLSIPACLTSDAVGSSSSAESVDADMSASSGSESPTVVRGKASSIGPRID